MLYFLNLKMKNEKLKRRNNSSNNIKNKNSSKENNNKIKDLEQKIKFQEEQISQLLKYKNLNENKIKEKDSSNIIPLDLEIYDNSSISISNILPNNNNSNKNNRNKSIKIPKTNSDFNRQNNSYIQNEKYNILYQKYVKLLQDYKDLSNNSIHTTTEYTKIKTQYNEVKEKNNELLKEINKKESEKEKIKELTQQVEMFREELVLSQALVNSLKAELESKNKEKNNINNKSIFDNEKIKATLKNNNMLLSSILQENNELRKKSTNYPFNNNDIINNNLLNNLQNNLNQYENKFDYFNEYMNNIKNKISLIFNDLKNIINNFEKNVKFSKDIKLEINNLNNIDRFNLDSIDDEKCLQSYMNLVKFLLNDYKNRDANIIVNKQSNIFNKTKNQIIELNNIIKINEQKHRHKKGGLKRLISDALNIIINLSNLYGIKYIKPEERNNINEKIIKLENEFDYIKKIISNYETKNLSKKLTYTLSYNTQRYKTIDRNSYNNYFKYK